MLLLELKLQHFKNYEEVSISFSDGANCLIGKNGMGKTNLLDAIFNLAMTKSALNLSDQQLICHGKEYYAINSVFQSEEGPLKVNLYCEKAKKKALKVNGVEAGRMSDHIGRIPCVITTPDDSGIIQEGSDIRRRLFDMVIAQCDSAHLKNLMEYQKVLKQRNSLLKSAEDRKRFDATLLEVYDDQLIPLSRSIALRRSKFSGDFIDFFETNYQSIFNGPEHVRIDYDSESLADDFVKSFKDNRQRDILLQRTEKGCHKDDYQFSLNGHPLKKFGSQGQQKSFIIALKLGEYDYLKALKNTSPLLLLDDIFDKLDDERIAHLVNLLSDSERFPQFFITDARAERSRTFFDKMPRVKFLEIENGTIK